MKSSLPAWPVIIHIAGKLGIEPNTLAQWHHRQYVPPSRHHEFVKAAKALNLPLTHETLHKMWKQNFKSRGKQAQKTQQGE